VATIGEARAYYNLDGACDGIVAIDGMDRLRRHLQLE
jgi:hypothetical protein